PDTAVRPVAGLEQRDRRAGQRPVLEHRVAVIARSALLCRVVVGRLVDRRAVLDGDADARAGREVEGHVVEVGAVGCRVRDRDLARAARDAGLDDVDAGGEAVRGADRQNSGVGGAVVLAWLLHTAGPALTAAA